MTTGSRWRAATARWRRTGFRGPAAGAIVVGVLAAAGLAFAAAGDLDAGFGNGGAVVLPLNSFIHNWEGRAVAVQPDGKILVAAQFRVTDPDDQTHEDLTIWRFLSNGTLDLSFGSQGGAFLDLPGSQLAEALVLQPDGRILVAGMHIPLGFDNSEFIVARFTTSGTPDPTFSGRGFETFAFHEDHGCGAFALALQPDGKIFVAGWTQGLAAPTELALVRMTSDGERDPTFGRVVTDFGGQSFQTWRALAIQNNGKVVAAGSAGGDFALARFRPDGSLDPTFDQDGRVTTGWGGDDGGARAVAIQPNGLILAAGGGRSRAGLPEFALARYRANGRLDRNFGGSGAGPGRAICSFASARGSTANAMALQPDGTILVGGAVFLPAGTANTADFALARFRRNGRLDARFGGDGRVTTHLGVTDQIFALALQPDGEVVAAGSSEVIVPTLALARYLAR